MATRAHVLVTALLVLFAAIAQADGDFKMPGNNIKIDDAWSKSGAVFEGVLTHMGPVLLTLPGQSLYVGNQVRVLHMYRRSVDSAVTLTFGVNVLRDEKSPKIGEKYIFFVTEDVQATPTSFGKVSMTAFKIVPATTETEMKARVLEIGDSKR